jgi:hypothetical protein
MTGNRPQSLTGHIVKRYAAYNEITTNESIYRKY